MRIKSYQRFEGGLIEKDRVYFEPSDDEPS